MKYRVWQVGWELSAEDVECVRQECPACKIVSAPPKEWEGLSQVVVAYAPTTEISISTTHFRALSFLRINGVLMRKCAEATDLEIEDALYLGKQAERGEIDRWINGVKHIGGLV